MKNSYVLLTGGAGYIGSHIAYLLIKKNYKLLIIDDLSTGKKKNFVPKKAKFIRVNILNKQNLKN